MSLKNWTWSFDTFSLLVVALAPTAITDSDATVMILIISMGLNNANSTR
jgi:hypothetical protein